MKNQDIAVYFSNKHLRLKKTEQYTNIINCGNLSINIIVSWMSESILNTI